MTVITLPPPDLDLAQNVTWQYDLAPHFNSLVASKQLYYDSHFRAFWSNWFTAVFDLKDNPNQFGLIVWSIILGVPTSIIYQPSNNVPPWGFGNGRENFHFSNFFGIATSYLLTLDEARRLLRMRYYAQTMSPTPYNINYALADVFSDLGVAYLEPTTGLTPPMTQQYTFTFPLSANFKNALIAYDILPRGSGVSSTIVSP